MGENEDDNVVLMPYRTGRIVAPRTSDWMLLVIRAHSGQLPTALDQVEEVLRRRRGVRANEPSSFDLSTADRIIKQFDGITAAIGLIAIAISSVSLLVGGIGVMNIMLVSVTERTQEIGVRKALGARRRDIVRQFLFEAMALTVTGGIIGILLAVLTSRVLLWLLPALPSQIPAWAVVAGLAVSTGVGLGLRRVAREARGGPRPGRGAALRVGAVRRRDGDCRLVPGRALRGEVDTVIPCGARYRVMPAESRAPGEEIEKWEIQLRKGTLELAVLASLWPGRLYGLEILRHLQDGSGLTVPEGTVYPLLSRLKADGLVDAEWVEGEAGHPRKYYRLTPRGRRHALQMQRSWSSFAASLERLLVPLRKEGRS